LKLYANLKIASRGCAYIIDDKAFISHLNSEIKWLCGGDSKW
jgi:hypothetical protein